MNCNCAAVSAHVLKWGPTCNFASVLIPSLLQMTLIQSSVFQEKRRCHPRP
jgi:hypothetical protein